MKVATQSAATDPTTGLIDMEAINTGVTFGARQKKEQVIKSVREYLIVNRERYENKKGIALSNLREEIMKGEEAAGEQEFREGLRVLMEEGAITVTNLSHPNPIIRIANLN